METHIQYSQRINQPYKYVLPLNPREKYSEHPQSTFQILRETEKCPFPEIRQLIIFYRLQNLEEGPSDLSKAHKTNKDQTKLMYGSLIGNRMSDSPLKQTKIKASRKYNHIEQNINVIDINRNYSDILRHEYSMGDRKSIDDEILDLSDKFEVAEMKIDMLLKCTQRYNTYFEDARKNLKENSQKKLREPRQIRQQNEREIEDSLRRYKDELRKQKAGLSSMDNMGLNSRDKEQKYRDYKKQLLNKRAKDTLTIYKNNQQNFSKTNTNVLQYENQYFIYEAYSQQFERAIITATLSQATYFKVHKNQQEIREEQSQMNSLNLESELKGLKRKIKYFSQLLAQYLFRYREQSKFPDADLDVNYFLKKESGGIDSSSVMKSNISHKREEENKDTIRNLEDAYRVWNENIEKDLSRIFSYLPTISKSLMNDRQKNRELYERMTAQYPDFLKEYTCVEETLKIEKKNSRYRQIINSEKNRLLKHLEKNYGMIVPYSWSEQYEKYILPLSRYDSNSQKYYLKKLFEKELQPLQQGIIYINRDYQTLYKNVCDQNRGVNREIEKRIKIFQKYSGNGPYDERSRSSDWEIDSDDEDNNKFMIHLLESCRKLMRLVNN